MRRDSSLGRYGRYVCVARAIVSVGSVANRLASQSRVFVCVCVLTVIVRRGIVDRHE